MPDGHVHLSMPKDLTDEDARLFIVAKWTWIQRQREEIANQPRQTPRQYVYGENYYFLGERYMLNVVELRITPTVKTKGNQLYLYVWPKSSRERREEVLREWYRVRLQKLLSPMVDEWAERLGETNFNVAGAEDAEPLGQLYSQDAFHPLQPRPCTSAVPMH